MSFKNPSSFAILSLGIASLAGSASAEDSASSGGFYFGGALGVSTHYNHDGFPFSVSDYDDPNPGFVGSLILGTQLSALLRAELELSYFRNETNCAPTSKCFFGNPGHEIITSASAILGNLWLDIPTQGELQPYVGFGVGASKPNFRDGVVFGSPEVTSDGPMYQIGMGVRKPLPSGAILDIGIRQQRHDWHTVSGSSMYDVDYRITSVLFGLSKPF